MADDMGPDSTLGTDASAHLVGGDVDQEIYHGYSVDDETQPQDTGDSLTDARDVEPMEEGYSPPEKWSAGERWGNTPLEEELGENIEQRLAQEIPEPDPYVQAELEAEAEPHGLDSVIPDEEIAATGADRAGRLVAPDEGMHPDRESMMLGTDVGIDGAAASAEEAAVHIVEDI